MSKYHPLDVRYAPPKDGAKPWRNVSRKENAWSEPGPIQPASDRKAREAYRDQVEREERAKLPWYLKLNSNFVLINDIRAMWVSRSAVARNVFSVPLQIIAAIALYFAIGQMFPISSLNGHHPMLSVSNSDRPALSTQIRTMETTTDY